MFITHAAIMYTNGEVIEGRDYGKIQHIAQQIGFSGTRILGFTNSSGDFVLPDEAAQIANESGQIKKRVSELTPDDLWPVVVLD